MGARTLKLAPPVEAAALRTRIGCLSSAPWNPYLRLLYGHLALHGVDVEWDARLSFAWLWRSRRTVRVLHAHWPEGLYRFQRGSARLRPVLGWAKLLVLALRLTVARTLGYRIVWTVHQVMPHESTNPAHDRLGVRVLASLCNALIVHDEATKLEVEHALGRHRRLEVIPHGSYVGVYPPGRPADVVAGTLGIPRDAFVFLAFGELRRYKGIELLLDAFTSLPLPNAILLVAGNPKEPEAKTMLEEAAKADPRLRLRLDFVREEEVSELYDLCDVAVLARSDGGTSGSLVLALSLGRAIVAADTPAYRELTDGRAGWLFAPGDVESLRSALRAAASDRHETAIRGRIARELAEELDWKSIAESTARLLASLE